MITMTNILFVKKNIVKVTARVISMWRAQKFDLKSDNPSCQPQNTWLDSNLKKTAVNYFDLQLTLDLNDTDLTK